MIASVLRLAPQLKALQLVPAAASAYTRTFSTIQMPGKTQNTTDQAQHGQEKKQVAQESKSGGPNKKAVSKTPPGATRGMARRSSGQPASLASLRTGIDDIFKSFERDFFGAPFAGGGFTPFSAIAPLSSRFTDMVPQTLLAMSMDVKETPTAYVIKAEIPGCSKDNLHIEVDEHRGCVTVMTEISGDTTDEGEEESDAEDDGKFLLRERSYGKSERTVYLPDDADLDQAQEAELKDGLLVFNVPKRQEGKGKRKLNIK